MTAKLYNRPCFTSFLSLSLSYPLSISLAENDTYYGPVLASMVANLLSSIEPQRLLRVSKMECPNLTITLTLLQS